MNQLEKVLFLWCYQVQTKRLSPNIRREICLYLPRCYRFIGVQDTSLAVYTLPGSHQVRIPLSHPFTPGTMHCWINPTNLLFVGSGSFFETAPPFSDVHSLNTQDCTITTHPSLLQPRCRPGLVYMQGTVYVFGGGCGFAYFTSCEKFSIPRKSWSRIAEMKYARYLFTPVPHNCVIYLADTCNNSGVLEAYHPASDTFEVVHKLLPSLSEASLSFLQGDTLVVLSRTAFWSWEIGASDSSKRFLRMQKSVASSCPPEVVDGKVYWLETQTGQLTCISLADLKRK